MDNVRLFLHTGPKFWHGMSVVVHWGRMVVYVLAEIVAARMDAMAIHQTCDECLSGHRNGRMQDTGRGSPTVRTPPDRRLASPLRP